MGCELGSLPGGWPPDGAGSPTVALHLHLIAMRGGGLPARMSKHSTFEGGARADGHVASQEPVLRDRRNNKRNCTRAPAGSMPPAPR